MVKAVFKITSNSRRSKLQSPIIEFISEKYTNLYNRTVYKALFKKIVHSGKAL